MVKTLHTRISCTASGGASYITVKTRKDMKPFRLFRKRPMQVFEKEFPVVGKMHCEARNEKECRVWTKRINFCGWKDCLLTFGDDPADPEKLSAMSRQMDMALRNQNQILSQVKADVRYQNFLNQGKDCLVPDSDGNVELVVRVTDDTGDHSPFVGVGYCSNGLYVWFPIQDGSVTAFTAEKA